MKRQIAAVCTASLLLTLCSCACSSELPDRTKEETTSTTQTEVATTASTSDSTSRTIAVVAASDKTVDPDIADMTINMPTTPEKEDGKKPADVVDMLVDQGADKENIEQKDEGGTTTFTVTNLSPRDTRHIINELPNYGATLASVNYSASDISSVKNEALKEALESADAEAVDLAKIVGGEIKQDVKVTENPYEIIAQNENEVTVRISITAEYLLK